MKNKILILKYFIDPKYVREKDTNQMAVVGIDPYVTKKVNMSVDVDKMPPINFYENEECKTWRSFTA